MKKKKKIKVKKRKVLKKTRILHAKKKIRKLKTRRAVRQEEQPFTMFDSNKGEIGNLFSAGFDGGSVSPELGRRENIVTFADFKKENSEKLENSLKLEEKKR